MQQLNVLPVNVSQSVDTKDESSAISLATSKDDFSKHIDMHLSKNKDASHNKNKEADKKLDDNTTKTSDEASEVKSNEKTQQSSDNSLVSSEDAESANNTQDVAASGKTDDNELNKESTNEDVKELDDSELLMSFLIKADKTLINTNSSENINFDEVPAEQKTKSAAQLLLESSDLVANLSNVAKALRPNSEVVPQEVSEQAPLVEVPLGMSKKIQVNGDTSQLNEKPLVKENIDLLSVDSSNEDSRNEVSSKEVIDSDLLSNDKKLLNQPLNVAKVVEREIGDKLVNDNLNGNLKVALKDFVDNNLESNISNKIDEGTKEVSLKELNKSVDMPDVKNTGSTDVKLTSIPKERVQSIIDAQSSIGVEANANEKIVQQVRDATKQSNHLSSSNLGQISTEALMKQNKSAESEGQLSAKSVEHLIEQSKEFSVDVNKDVSNKVVVKTNTDFSLNSNFTDVTGKATQVAQEVIEQHAIDVFNPTGSSEVSQSQKTNTQLHQETISIFRRDFADAVKDKVMLMISQKLQQFDITLDPPELGNMHVRVNLQGEQATVNFIVQNQQAKEAFEQNMHKLKELLAEQGVDVGDANVEQQSQQSDNEANNEENADNGHHESMKNTADASDVIEHSLSAEMINSSITAVDYYA